jgi:hypothetical protein
MPTIKDLLYSFVHNPSVDNRFRLAEEYYSKQQYAIALTFYLKTAEVSEDKNQQYYCLIQCARCFEIPGNRKHSVMTLYKHAIKLLPDRPEAYYYLSRLYELHNDWIDAYFYAELGTLKAPSNDSYQVKLNYPAKYGLLFQKAISAWHIGRGEESRSILHLLKNTLFKQMDLAHQISLQQNITRLGSSEPFVIYSRENYSRLKHKFLQLETVDCSYSQSMQDIFVLSILNGKQNGTYLEIGSAHPNKGNNTFLLEDKFNWTGIGLEIDPKLVETYNKSRKNKSLEQDAVTADYSSILEKINTNIIDYLQLDAEPATKTYEILTKIPFDKYKFRVITYEHDYYADITQTCRNLSREYLENLGYKLVVNDICADSIKRCSYEDWWVHPDLVDSERLSLFIDNNLNVYKYPEEYFYK